MIEQHSSEMGDLRDVLYAMELRFTEREAEAEQEFQGMVDDLKNKVSQDKIPQHRLTSSPPLKEQ